MNSLIAIPHIFQFLDVPSVLGKAWQSLLGEACRVTWRSLAELLGEAWQSQRGEQEYAEYCASLIIPHSARWIKAWIMMDSVHHSAPLDSAPFHQLW